MSRKESYIKMHVVAVHDLYEIPSFNAKHFLLTDVAEKVFNNCTSQNMTNADHPNYKITFNYEFLDDQYSTWTERDQSDNLSVSGEYPVHQVSAQCLSVQFSSFNPYSAEFFFLCEP